MTAVVPPSRPAPSAPAVERLTRTEDGESLGTLLWRAGEGWRMISNAVLGGGIGERAWVLNAQVAHGYRRTDPDRHLAELARDAGAHGPGVGLMTAADVRAYGSGRDGGVTAVATAGLGVRGWTADWTADWTAVAATAVRPGTVNIVVAVPVALTDAALVNTVMTATEAKVQALVDAGLDCSGTPTDAVCVAVRRPRAGEEAHAFGGPRSLWGSRVARAVHRAVTAAIP
ncbi:adenosylcobinamide amidohydrolase [Streptomyces sp. NPDC046859]|uniref:adenosylcobinamide amidohydrolase n=1 Tax=Streptomyces sp. NPDC046859 TaxID=3155734 RepID=UPI0033D29C8A